jgi:glycosyltransferase involved in cell wall biosynthesis
MDVELVVPCYNEERRLAPDAFERSLALEPRLSLRFVDDGSRDGTREVLERLRERAPERISVQALERNSGKAEAVRQGMLAAIDGGATAIGYWDADLATPLDELPGFVDVLERSGDVDVVLGSRVKLLGRRIERHLYRHVYGRAFATVVSLMLDLPVYDTQCGAKVFRGTEDVRAAFGEPFLSRWIFDVELLMRLVKSWNGRSLDAAQRIVEIPLHTWTDVPGSKVTPRDAVRAIGELTALAKRYGIRTK